MFDQTIAIYRHSVRLQAMQCVMYIVWFEFKADLLLNSDYMWSYVLWNIMGFELPEAIEDQPTIQTAS